MIHYSLAEADGIQCCELADCNFGVDLLVPEWFIMHQGNAHANIHIFLPLFEDSQE